MLRGCAGSWESFQFQVTIPFLFTFLCPRFQTYIYASRFTSPIPFFRLRLKWPRIDAILKLLRAQFKRYSMYRLQRKVNICNRRSAQWSRCEAKFWRPTEGELVYLKRQLCPALTLILAPLWSLLFSTESKRKVFICRRPETVVCKIQTYLTNDVHSLVINWYVLLKVLKESM